MAARRRKKGKDFNSFSTGGVIVDLEKKGEKHVKAKTGKRVSCGKEKKGQGGS